MRALPTADPFLADFFADRRRGAFGVRLDRIDRAESDLRLAVELTGPEVLDPDDRVLLHAERQLEPVAAVARVLPLTALPAVLQRFLTEPLYRPRPVDEARDRLDTVAALVRALARMPELLPETRALRRLDERVRIELATLAPRRARIRVRRVRG
ncbi:hypothetical protein [Amnibacterium kyonggiense]|uniref:Uncharacterized protein n=1 Tax=Amnibacterium kyonggiense TaxID=595671 RepID=A0A4R7FL71_9MICO|nr:hypothetical protein [Amnibacterium kyonggiense]TDS77109.1 hypothetical protein CLV52_2049 [Amnibacterium kyonggiense]